MSMLGRLFGGEKEERLPLDPSSTAAARLERHRDTIEAFVRKVHDKLELVPGERAIYVFIGKPPDMFGIAWLEAGEEHNFKRLMKDKGLSQQQVQIRSDELRSAWLRHRDEPKYVAEFAGKKVLVTPSPGLERDVVEIIHRTEA